MGKQNAGRCGAVVATLCLSVAGCSVGDSESGAEAFLDDLHGQSVVNTMRMDDLQLMDLGTKFCKRLDRRDGRAMNVLADVSVDLLLAGSEVGRGGGLVVVMVEATEHLCPEWEDEKSVQELKDMV